MFVGCAVSYLLKSTFPARETYADSTAGEIDADSTSVNYLFLFDFFTLFSINDCHVKALSQEFKPARKYNEIMFTQDPKSAKVSKDLESPILQSKVNNPGSSILLGISPWINANPFLPSSKLSTYLSRIALYIGA
ncbi:hypothetical protein Tco_1282955 [Tanacetum coccineum]